MIADFVWVLMMREICSFIWNVVKFTIYSTNKAQEKENIYKGVGEVKWMENETWSTGHRANEVFLN